MKQKKIFGTGIEEIILITLIYLNIIDFLEVIPSDLDYAKKIISWVGLGLLLYKVSPTKIFFGQKNKKFDISLIIIYFLFIMKNMVAYSKVALELTHGGLRELYKFILANTYFFENTLIKIGIILIMALALLMTFKLKVKKPSTLDVIHNSESIKKSFVSITKRFLSILIVIFGFFFIVFNLMMEWLAIAIDAPLLMIGLGGYFMLAIKYKHTFKSSKAIYDLGNMGEKFYEKFIVLFQSKKIYLGIIGMLVLHLLTDIGNFVLPYIFSIHDDLYFGQFTNIHRPLIYLFNSEKLGLLINQIPELLLIYLLNITTLLLFMIIPALIWKKLSNNESIHLPKFILVILYTGIPAFLFTPLFKIQRLGEQSLRGIDILSQKILANTAFSLDSVLILSLILGVITFVIVNTKFKPLLDLFTFFVSATFFGRYLFLYFTDLLTYYQESLIFLLNNSEIIMSIFIILSIIYAIIFYVGGFFIYIYSAIFEQK